MGADSDKAFWEAIDALVLLSRIVIDRPKGSAHPRYPSLVYPLDYGYLSNSSSMDGGGIDVWMGTAQSRTVGAVVCTVDLRKRDSEMKVLIGCTPEEMRLVYEFHNRGEHMKGLLVKRD